MKKFCIIPLEERIVFNADVPVAGLEGAAVQFNADAFFPGHPATGGATYGWDFDHNGTFESGPTSNTTTTHVFADNGVYAVTGKMSVAGQPDTLQDGSVTISNVRPTVLAPPVQQFVPVLDLPWVMVAKAQDPSPVDSLSLTAKVNWGDGTPLQNLTVIGPNPGPGVVAPPGSILGLHLYHTAGPKTVTIFLTDKDGGTSSRAINISVSTDVSLFRLPVIPGGVNNVIAQQNLANAGESGNYLLWGTPLQINAAPAVDSEGHLRLQDLTIKIKHDSQLVQVDALRDAWFKDSGNEGNDNSVFSFKNNKLTLQGDPSKVYTVTLTVRNGAMSLVGGDGLQMQGDPANDSRLVLTGTLEDINRAMEGLTYTRQTDVGIGDDHSSSITVSLRDIQSTGTPELVKTVSLSFTPELHFTSPELVYHQALPLLLASDATFSDADAKSYDGGLLVVDFIDPAGKDSGTPRDQLSLLGSDGVVIVGSEIHVNGVPVAVVRDGSNGKPLVIEFNSQSTPQSVQQVMQKISYSNDGDKASGVKVARFTVVDHDGNSQEGYKFVNLGQ